MSRLILGSVLLVVANVLSAAAAPAPAADVSKLIDGEINARLQVEKIKAAPRADDVTLHRRLYLDLLGRIPTTDETTAFLNDKRPDRIDQLIDRLLIHPEMAVYWRRVLSGWLNAEQSGIARSPGYPEFLTYLEQSLAANKSWDKIAREALLPNEEVPTQKGASFFLAGRLVGDKESQFDNVTTAVASSLFGVQIQCAKCHDHPQVEDWTQDHYYGLGAVFSNLEKVLEKGSFVLKEKKAADVKFITRKKLEKIAKPMFLDSKVFNGTSANLRQDFVSHAVTSESSFFKRSLANRAWKQLMGRGLVEPVDQMHSENPASHPQLLERLADDTARNGFDLRRLLDGILHSDAYRRSTIWPSETRPKDDLYAVGILRPLSPQQMAWAIATATGYTDNLAARFTKELKDVPAKGAVGPDLHRRWERDREFDDMVDKFQNNGETFQANASQALFVTFSPFMQKMRKAAPGNLTQKLVATKSPAELAELAFRAVLSRPPTTEESAEFAKYLETGPKPFLCEEIVLLLISTAEFRFAH